ncbi:hypothetical protein CDAR_223091 [Caerostris darwini]|uniref:Uncharacterized protein n=1 Tax=Caerostris darwini TaxID=1538125 RepID=A0AAV4SUS5_9ARAC|nr:hypothetical protein CDAR_223091 [Caerostris darwini]
MNSRAASYLVRLKLRTKCPTPHLHTPPNCLVPKPSSPTFRAEEIRRELELNVILRFCELNQQFRLQQASLFGFRKIDDMILYIKE